MRDAHQLSPTPILLALVIGSGMVTAMLTTGQAVSTGGWRVVASATLVALGGGAIYFTAQNLRTARAIASTSPEAGHLITEGIFSTTRNPLCLGLLLALAGLAKIFDTPWAYVAPALFFVLGQWLHIRPEEARLTAIYGEKYLAYKSRVRRWV